MPDIGFSSCHSFVKITYIHVQNLKLWLAGDKYINYACMCQQQCHETSVPQLCCMYLWLKHFLVLLYFQPIRTFWQCHRIMLSVRSAGWFPHSSKNTAQTIILKCQTVMYGAFWTASNKYWQHKSKFRSTNLICHWCFTATSYSNVWFTKETWYIFYSSLILD